MATRIYFGGSGAHSSLSPRERVSRGLMAAIFRLGGWLLPATTVRLARRFLSTPCRLTNQEALPGEYQQFTLDTSAGGLVVHSAGRGPVVLFSHGWSGNAAQFKPLMQQVVNAGYQAVALDHYRHGESDGDESNFLLFIEALRLVAKHLENNQTPVTAVVGHSVGGMASLHAFDASSVPHLLISPVIGVYQHFRDCAFDCGLNESLFDTAVEAIEAAQGQRFATFDEKTVLRDPAVKVHFLHSRNDRFIPVKNSVDFQAQAPHVELTLGVEGGHSSVLNYLSTSAVLLSWLSQVTSPYQVLPQTPGSNHFDHEPYLERKAV